MASRTEYSNAELKAGIFITACMLLFVALLFVYGKAERLLRGQQEIRVVFTSVTSLRPDAPVRYNGYEVGRVKDIKVIHLLDEELKRLPAISVRDLPNLPLTEAEQKTLRDPKTTPAEAFQDEIKKKLANRTMIALTLEVLQEGDKNRFRYDDEVHINTTLMGDTWVEISSGSGEILKAGESSYMLGRSGDFFTNLAKSVEQVKEILGSVSDLVGPNERESVRKALRRFDTITERIEKIVVLADTRLPKTWDKVDGLADNAKENINRVGDAVQKVQPKLIQTLGNADEAIKDLQGRVGGLADEAKGTVQDVRAQIKPILADVQVMTGKTKEDLPQMVRSARDLAVRLQESAGKLDAVLSTGNKLLGESYPDLRRLVLALRLGAENFEEATNVLKRKPWLVYNPAKENEVYNNAQKTARDLEIATKRFAELSIELQALRKTLEGAPKDKVERIDFLLQELAVLSDTLKYAGDAARKEVLPIYERKKGGFIPIAEEFDPTLGRKKPGE